MDYKKEIIKMIDGIESQMILRYIYIIVADIYNDLRRQDIWTKIYYIPKKSKRK